MWGTPGRSRIGLIEAFMPGVHLSHLEQCDAITQAQPDFVAGQDRNELPFIRASVPTGV